jgi:hypothetical protein
MYSSMPLLYQISANFLSTCFWLKWHYNYTMPVELKSLCLKCMVSKLSYVSKSKNLLSYVCSQPKNAQATLPWVLGSFFLSDTLKSLVYLVLAQISGQECYARVGPNSVRSMCMLSKFCSISKSHPKSSVPDLDQIHGPDPSWSVSAGSLSQYLLNFKSVWDRLKIPLCLSRCLGGLKTSQLSFFAIEIFLIYQNSMSLPRCLPHSKFLHTRIWVSLRWLVLSTSFKHQYLFGFGSNIHQCVLMPVCDQNFWTTPTCWQISCPDTKNEPLFLSRFQSTDSCLCPAFSFFQIPSKFSVFFVLAQMLPSLRHVWTESKNSNTAHMLSSSLSGHWNWSLWSG